MSLIEKLDSVLVKWRANENGDGFDGPDYDRGHAEARLNCADDLDALMPAIRQAMIDAERYRWLRGSRNCSLSISHNDHHNMYLSVADTLDEPQGYYSDLSDAERAQMIATDTIWTVHVYPNTPVGFNVYHASTLDAAIDKARATGEGEGHD